MRNQWQHSPSPLSAARQTSTTSREVAQIYRDRFTGRRLEILIEERSKQYPEFTHGLTREYLRVYCGGNEIPRGSICRVCIRSIFADGLAGIASGDHTGRGI